MKFVRKIERPRSKISGLTIIEVLVAMTLLAVVSSAIVGSFALVTSLNRDTSADVDYSRLVRSVAEAITDDWEVPSEWNAGTVGGSLLAGFVDNETDGVCQGSWSAPDVDEVRVVTIVCEATGDLGAQTYQFEVGDPNV